MKVKKLLALSLSALLSLSVLAGCGGNNGNSGGGDTGGGEPPIDTPETPETPDKQAPAYVDGQATVTISGKINRTNPDYAISEDLFGLFLEDINYASQGMDDNLIANGSFEGIEKVPADPSLHGYAWTANGLTVTYEHDAALALHVNSPYYAKISAPTGGTFTNKGFDAVPMYIQNKQKYLFSAFFRGYTGEVTVRARQGANIYAEKTFDVAAPDTEWIKLEETVTATDTGDAAIVLELSFAAAESPFYLDGVQFETLDATEFGMKSYMYRAISDLSPAFFRFPGGCVIEGTSNYTAYDWKNSIGAVKDTESGKDTLPAFTYTLYKDGVESEAETYGEWVTRVPNGNIWQPDGKYYPHEYGIGFYEYFLLCDKLNAKAIPIVNCGLSCQVKGAVALSGRFNNGVQDFIQDAIDLIEFAKGDETTTWGKIRAQMGHPEPFEMDYIGIGNEQWGDYYDKYYEKFLKDPAFKAALKQYDLKPIVGNCTLFEHCENSETNTTGAAKDAAQKFKDTGFIQDISEYGVVDQHYYVNFTDFLVNTHLYDSYKRLTSDPENAYEVFVGEYAVNSQEIHAPTVNNSIVYKHTNNSMLTALSEAAMMTGFERNGDIVRLAAYAPMFGTQNGANRQWQVDMMYFDNQFINLTPNYYVQQLFMKNTGNYKVAAALQFADGVTAPKTTYTSTNKMQSRECDDIFFVASYDSETGDVILKLVNAGGTTLRTNVDLTTLQLTPTGIADVFELNADSADAVNTPDDELVSPRKRYTIGFEKGTFGYTVLPYSVTAIRIRTK